MRWVEEHKQHPWGKKITNHTHLIMQSVAAKARRVHFDILNGPGVEEMGQDNSTVLFLKVAHSPRNVDQPQEFHKQCTFTTPWTTCMGGPPHSQQPTDSSGQKQGSWVVYTMFSMFQKLWWLEEVKWKSFIHDSLQLWNMLTIILLRYSTDELLCGEREPLLKL